MLLTLQLIFFFHHGFSQVRDGSSEIILQLKEIEMENHWYGTRENDATLPGEVMKLLPRTSWSNSADSWGFAVEPTVLTVEWRSEDILTAAAACFCH